MDRAHDNFETSEQGKQDKNKFEDLILTSEEFKDQPFAREKRKGNYIFEINHGDKRLVYFGSDHTNDPDSPIFDEITKSFGRAEPQIVFVEGMDFINKHPDEAKKKFSEIDREGAKSKGESSYTLKLALEAGLDFESPEPEWSEEITYLLGKDFSKKDVLAYYVYRQVAQYQREKRSQDEKEWRKCIRPLLDDFKDESGWSSEELSSLEDEILGDIDLTDEDKYRRLSDPIPWDGKPQTVLNQVSRESNYFRDRHIFERITEAFEKYDKVFVVYGSAHAVKQKPALKAFLESLNH